MRRTAPAWLVLFPLLLLCACPAAAQRAVGPTDTVAIARWLVDGLAPPVVRLAWRWARRTPPPIPAAGAPGASDSPPVALADSLIRVFWGPGLRCARLAELPDGLLLRPAVGGKPLSRDHWNRVLEIVRRRLDTLLPASAATWAYVEGQTLVVVIPPLPAPQREGLAAEIARDALLEFRLVDETGAFARALPEALRDFGQDATQPAARIRLEQGWNQQVLQSESRDALSAFAAWLAKQGRVPEDRVLALEEVRWLDAGPDGRAQWRLHVLHADPVITNADVSSAQVTYAQQMGYEPQVSLEFTRAGGERFADVTQANVDHKLAIQLDGQVVSAPVIRERIAGGRAVITLGSGGDPARQAAEAQSLARTLDAGAYPARLVYAGPAPTPPASSLRITRALCYLPFWP